MFQRMMVIPQEENVQLTSVQAANQPLVREMKNLTAQYEEQSHIPDPYRKLVHQAETLDDMKELKDKLRQQIVDTAPKPYQSRTRSLLQHLEPFLKVNDRGEIFDDRNEVIEHSRIDDLIQYAVRDKRRSNFVPTGWYSFLRIIRDNNIPRNMLSRDTLDALQQPKVEVKVEPIPQRKSPRKRKIETSPTRQRPKRTGKKPRFLSEFS